MEAFGKEMKADGKVCTQDQGVEYLHFRLLIPSKISLFFLIQVNVINTIFLFKERKSAMDSSAYMYFN